MASFVQLLSPIGEYCRLVERGVWVKPDGTILDVEDHGESAAEAFGMEPRYSTDDDDDTADEKVAEIEGKAIRKALRSGWIQINDDIGNYVVTVNEWDNHERNLLYDFFAENAEPKHTVEVWLNSRKIWSGTVGDIRHGFFESNASSEFRRLVEIPNQILLESLAIGDFWVNSNTGTIIRVTSSLGHAGAIDDDPEFFGLSPYADDRVDYHNYYINGAIHNGWMRVLYNGVNLDIQAVKTRRAMDSVIELCSKVLPKTSVFIEWENGRNVYTTAGEIAANSSILESTLLEGVGYWLTDKGEEINVGDVADWEGDSSGVGPDGMSHTAYLRRNKLFSGDRFGVALRKGWIAIRFIAGQWTILVDKLDARTKDLLWDWAVKKGGSTTINFYPRDGKRRETTIPRIVKDFDYGEGKNESILQEEHNRWWLSPKGRLIDTGDTEHAMYVRDNPSVFGATNATKKIIGDVDYDTGAIESIWDIAISQKKWIRIAQYYFGYNITVPDLSQKTKDLLWDWAKKFPSDYNSVVYIDIYSGHFRIGRSGDRTSIQRIVKNFDFGDGKHESFANLIETLIHSDGWSLEPLIDSILEGSLDQIYRQEAIKAWNYVAEIIENSPWRLKQGIRIPGYSDLLVIQLPKEAISEIPKHFGGGFTPKGPNGGPTIILLDFPASLLRDTFIHEFFHYADHYRNPTLIAPPGYFKGDSQEVDWEKYSNTPSEINAFYQAAVAAIEQDLRVFSSMYNSGKASESELKAGPLHHLCSAKEFADWAVFRTGKDSGILQYGRQELRRRLMKRAYLDYPRVISYARRLGLPF